jgi:diguanylate cyclase
MAGELLSDLDAEYAATIADSAIRSMAKHSVPATPNNFAVWFSYAMGASPALRKTIDILVGSKRKFDTSVNHDLYLTYINPQPDAALGDFSEQLHGVMTSARQFLTTAIADNRVQMAALGEASTEFQVSNDPRPIIERLLAELSSATARAAALEKNFAAASQELDTIRNSLKEAEARSNTDALTGLANRRLLDDFLRSAQIAAMETEQPLSIFLIDIDHFKDFNDRYGHQIGDQVLRLVAKVLQENVREHDLAARYGGEELIAVLPGANLEVCQRVAERLRHRISEARLTRRSTGQEIASVTVSVGVAQFRLAESAEAMIERCDDALYQAKRSGRNRTVTENDIIQDKMVVA